MQWGLTAVWLDDTAFKQSKKVRPGYLYRNEKRLGSCLQNESMPRTKKTVRKYDVVKKPVRKYAMASNAAVIQLAEIGDCLPSQFEEKVLGRRPGNSPCPCCWASLAVNVMTSSPHFFDQACPLLLSFS